MQKIPDIVSTFLFLEADIKYTTLETVLSLFQSLFTPIEKFVRSSWYIVM